jgi:hypothetical protein
VYVDAMQQPHLDATMRILHYVMGQCFFQSFFELKLIDARFVNFVDFDWARELEKKISTTKHVQNWFMFDKLKQ